MIEQTDKEKGSIVQTEKQTEEASFLSDCKKIESPKNTLRLPLTETDRIVRLHFSILSPTYEHI